MSDDELAKDLGLLSAMTIGIGTMIGAGIFVLPGIAAQEAGPVVVLSFIAGGIIAMINALSVSELGTAMPKAGGGYYYVNRALGPMFGSIAGLGDWMGLAFASAFYAIGFGGYLVTFVPLPDVLFLSGVQVGALLAGVLFTAINYIGAKETGGIQTVIVLMLLGILGIFATGGALAFDYATLSGEALGDGQSGLAPAATGGFGAVFPAAALVFVSFLGYAKIATVAEEMKNPGRNLPIAIIGSVGIVTVIYAVLVTVMLGVVSWPDLSLETPVAQAAEVAFLEIGTGETIALGVASLMTIGALLATASSANASILSSARINFAMGRDKIVMPALNEIHPQYATPYRSILLTGALIVVFIATLGRDLAVLAAAASVLHLVVYALMNVALIVFREADVPEYDPDFEVPLYPITPILGTVFSLGLIAFMAPVEILLSALFVVGAVVWYFLYARDQTVVEGVLSEEIRERGEEMPDAVVGAADAVAPSGGEERPTVMVAISNPRTESALVTLAGAIAQHQGGRVLATHIVQVPDQTPLAVAAENRDRIGAESEKLLDAAKTDAETFDVPIETKTILSHRGLAEVFDAARTNDADTVVMGYGGARFAGGRVEGKLDELTHNLPCDFLVLNDRGFDPSRVLLPTAGGYSSDLSAGVAVALRDVLDASVSVLYVADEGEREAGEEFIADWAAEHDLSDAELLVEEGRDVEGAIEAAAADRTLVLIGATGRGLLSRVVGGSLAFSVLEELDTSVLLAERPAERSLLERLFGRQ